MHHDFATVDVSYLEKKKKAPSKDDFTRYGQLHWHEKNRRTRSTLATITMEELETILRQPHGGSLVEHQVQPIEPCNQRKNLKERVMSVVAEKSIACISMATIFSVSFIAAALQDAWHPLLLTVAVVFVLLAIGERIERGKWLR